MYVYIHIYIHTIRQFTVCVRVQVFPMSVKKMKGDETESSLKSKGWGENVRDIFFMNSPLWIKLIHISLVSAQYTH